MTMKRWMTRAEAADYMGVSLRTIDNWRRDGRLTRYTVRGLRSPRYAVIELDAMIVPVPADDKADSA